MNSTTATTKLTGRTAVQVTVAQELLQPCETTASTITWAAGPGSLIDRVDGLIDLYPGKNGTRVALQSLRRALLKAHTELVNAEAEARAQAERDDELVAKAEDEGLAPMLEDLLASETPAERSARILASVKGQEPDFAMDMTTLKLVPISDKGKALVAEDEAAKKAASKKAATNAAGKLTPDQKRRLGHELHVFARNLLDAMAAGKVGDEVADLPVEVAADQLAAWLKYIPSSSPFTGL